MLRIRGENAWKRAEPDGPPFMSEDAAHPSAGAEYLTLSSLTPYSVLPNDYLHGELNPPANGPHELCTV